MTTSATEADGRRANALRIAGVSTIERAYQIARSGQCQSVMEIKKRLRDEGFVDTTEQLTSRTLVIALRGLINAAAKA
jgi:hypothetical protein